MYEIKANDKPTIITGTIARPSKPSVRFTALEDPIIIKIPKGIKNQPKSTTKFLKKGNIKFVEISAGNLSPKTSIGISVFPKDGDSIDILIQNADKAMYKAKRSGKNQYTIY